MGLAVPATNRSEGITSLVWDLFKVEMFGETSKQVHPAGIGWGNLELRKKILAREMNLAAIGIGMVLKAMRQDEIPQGEGGSRTGPRQSPRELQREHVKLKSLFRNKRN